jgi:hypothetical protein
LCRAMCASEPHSISKFCEGRQEGLISRRN